MNWGKSARKFLAALLMAALGFMVPAGVSAAPEDLNSAESSEETYDPLNTMLALNMAIVSVNRVVTTQDRIVLDQEYGNIINNLSIGNIEDDYELKSLYETLMDTITNNKLRDEEAKRFQEAYDRGQKRALTSAIVNTRMPIGGSFWSFVGSLLATGVQTYFGYQDQKEQLHKELDNSLWQLKKEAVLDFNDLQKKLLSASWSLLRQYHLPDEYRITQEDLGLLSKALSADKPSAAAWMFSRLESKFRVYPPFWYFYGEAANKSGDKKKALQCYDQFDKVWRPALRRDPYRLQVAKERIYLEPEITPERIRDLLAIVKENIAPADWMDNLFYGAVAYSVDMKQEGMDAVRENIFFEYEKDISPVLLSSMESGKMNLTGLSQEIQAAVAAGEKSAAAAEAKKKISSARIDGNIVEALQLWFDGKDGASAELCRKLVEENRSDPVLYYLYYRELSDGTGIAKDLVKAQQYRNKHDELIKTTTESYKAIAPWCRETAEKGNARAQFLYGRMLGSGLGVGKNEKSAAEWYRKSAEQGNTVAQCNLGDMYYYGEGVSKDFAEAAKWYRKSAEQGNASAQTHLGYMYDKGEGVSKDPAEAVKWFRKSAEQGYARAQHNLGWMYANGEGVSKDPAEAVKWFRKSAEQGDASAQCNLGNMYYNGEGVSKDPAEAVEWYRKSAEQGDAVAQYSLGNMYYNGEGVSKDPAEAVEWYRKSAEQGNASAQFNLGNMYYNGEGVSKDPAEAVKWYCKSAEQGDASAQCNLGNMYYNGEGVSKDLAEAAKWYRKSAEQGHARAQCNLGNCYYRGNGVPRDYEEAYVWYYLARMNGNDDAQKMLDGLEKNGYLSSEAISRARSRAQQMYDKQHGK